MPVPLCRWWLCPGGQEAQQPGEPQPTYSPAPPVALLPLTLPLRSAGLTPRPTLLLPLAAWGTPTSLRARAPLWPLLPHRLPPRSTGLIPHLTKLLSLAATFGHRRPRRLSPAPHHTPRTLEQDTSPYPGVDQGPLPRSSGASRTGRGDCGQGEPSLKSGVRFGRARPRRLSQWPSPLLRNHPALCPPL